MTGLNPAAHAGHADIGEVLLRQGRFEEALREARHDRNEWARLTVEAQALWALDRRTEANTALARLAVVGADIGAIQIAQVHAFRRESDRAFEWLERAYRQRDPGIAFCKLDRALATLHDDPRWTAFLQRIGLAGEQLQ
jgi:hypothetical protein